MILNGRSGTIVLLVFLVMLCALESLIVDFIALDMDVGRIFLYSDERRIALLLACGALLCLCLPRFVFVAFVLFQFVANLFIISYAAYMSNAPFMISITGSWQAAMNLGTGNMLSFVSLKNVLILFLSLALKLYLFYLYQRRPLRLKARLFTAMAVLAIILSFHIHLYKRMDISIFNFSSTVSMSQGGRFVSGGESFIARYMAGQIGLAYTWLGEFITGNYKNVDMPSLVQLEDTVGERLPNFVLPRTIVMVQMESLDLCLVSLEKNEQRVMPFLNSLKNRSILVPIAMQRKVGSANSDFEIFSGNPAIFPLIYYTFLPKSTYQDFLVTEINKAGYETIAFVNDPSTTFHMRAAYEAMGFKHVNFLEQVAAEYGAKWLNDRDDQKLVDYAISLLDADKQQFLFLVTMSTHPPFFGSGNRFGRGNYNELYHSTAYDTDNALERLYEALPPGALFFIWGDHPSGSDIIKGMPCDKMIPLIINVKGQDISSHVWHDAPLNSLYEVGIYLRRLFTESKLASSD